MSAFIDSPRLPIIDLLPLESGGAWRDHVAAQLDWAASELGFFYITGHGVDQAVIDTMLQRGRSFFRMREESKLAIHVSRGGRALRGYFPVGGEFTAGRPDLREGLYFGEELPEDDDRVRAGLPLHGRNLFPELPGFREATLEYMQALTGLGHRLMSGIGRGLRLGDTHFVDRYTGRPTTLFRIFNYPPAAADSAAEHCGVDEHTDYGLIALVYQDEVGGLQVKHGSSWIDVPPVPGAFVVTVGDILERLTEGRYTSAVHRVINHPQRSRVSMPFFFDPHFDAQLPVHGTYGDYLQSRLAEICAEVSP
jgi:isopenicillin N synthase-like dioxygenase